MSAKEIILETVKKMPDKASMDEIVEKLAILAAIRRGEEAADKGKVISHAAMKKRARSWRTK
jgi:predicted transcriptional regulator